MPTIGDTMQAAVEKTQKIKQKNDKFCSLLSFTHKTLGGINVFTFVVFVCTVQDAAEHAEVHDNVVARGPWPGPKTSIKR